MSFCDSPRYHPWKLFKRKNLTSLPQIVDSIPRPSLFGEQEDKQMDIVALCCSFSPDDSCIIAGLLTPTSHFQDDLTLSEIPNAFAFIWDVEEDGCEENTIFFTYSAMPNPSFSSCGNIYSCIVNSSQGCLDVCGYLENEESYKDFQKRTLKTIGGNLHGRTRCLSVSHRMAVTITNLRMMQHDLENCILTCWNVSDDFTLRHSWTRKIQKVFSGVRLNDIRLQSCVISSTSKVIGVLLSNGLLAIIDTKKPDQTFQLNLFASLQFENGTSTYQRPIVFSFFSDVAVSDAVIAVGYQRRFGIMNVQHDGGLFKILPDRDDGIKHIDYSKNRSYMSISSVTGNVYIYAVDSIYELLYTLSRKTQHIHATFSSFSSSSEELVVSYSDGVVSIWQLPRIMNLKEICRLKILTVMALDRIQSLDIPKKLIEFLSFNCIIRD